ncbi:MAG: TonB-dependent receptor [Flavipsychrobacter sp.]|nr:TonB-dependent receptor [Flavipsychrobacter sp.]
MTRTLRILLLFVFTGLTGSAFAQEISGRVLDEKKEPMPSAVIQVYQGGILRSGTVTDYDGNYTVKPLDPGYYDVLVLYTGYDSIKETGVIVTPGARTTRNYSLSRHNDRELKTITVIAYKKPLVDQDKPNSHVLTSEEIKSIPTTEVSDLVSLSSGSYQQKRGGAINIGGARSDGTLYIIDGVQVRGTTGVNMSQGSVDQLEVITSGIPANYGDVSGGVVNITSRGVSQKLTGSVRLQHSIDGYKNNLASFSIAGPIYKKRIKGDSLHKKPVLGFALSADFYSDKDRYPTYNQQYRAKGDVLDELQKNPLKIVTDNTGSNVYNYSSAYVTYADLEKVKVPSNNTILEGRLNGKLNFQVNEHINIVAGANVSYQKQDQYNRALIVFSPQAIPVRYTGSGRGFIRFTQKFGKSNDTSSKKSIISNAYYTLQADYQKVYISQEHPDFKKNLFEYGYIGKFTQKKSYTYFPLSKDSVSQRTGTVLQGTNLFGVNDGVYFERSELNPYLANYTTQYFNSLNGFHPTTINQIQSKNALANGDQPQLTYGEVFSPGQTITSYSSFNSNQYALTVDASFDLLIGKTKHAIGFGLYYQQRVERSYFATGNYGTVGSNTLWAQMRQLVSSIDNGNLKLDKQNPIFKVNGQQYTLAQINNGVVIPGANDTIIYNYKNYGSGTGNGLGTQFDQNLRKKLGLKANEDINVDELAPSTFSLDMFTADELLASGRPFVKYEGYSYTGGSQGTVNFNDFWTQKDANGNYTRPVAAFAPNYIAGYLLDKFNYKDLHFNVGLRIDRYSSNTKVLIDPYSLYPEKNVSQVSGANNVINLGEHPKNIGSSYVVYVDDNSSANPNIIGYRNGNSWYDAKGQFIEDPSVLKTYSGGRNPEPYLVKDKNNKIPNIIDTNFNPNASFTDYTPQVNIQPRLSFNFPISDVADFYAHYDIYAQRPTSNSYASPVDYYFLQQNANLIIDNSALKPQKTFDYEVGFQQKLNDHAALTINAFYKERKDMITVVPYLYAWPTTYYTYGNRDFSTTKGTTLTYDMRATNHLRLNVAYTLQFAEGTGSTANSTNGNASSNGQISNNGLLQSFIQAGLPNLRYVYALDYDSRHVIAANINYSYGDGEGPVVSGKNIFQRSSITLIPRARSGEPYTRFKDAQGNTVVGGVNGSRLPWHYMVDLRVDKEFSLAFGKKNKDALPGVKPKRPLGLRAILQVNNLLNTRDVLGVYNYTGKPDDNGYLTSSFGKQFAPQQTNEQSYKDIYSMYNNDPGHYNYARTMSIALEFNF